MEAEFEEELRKNLDSGTLPIAKFLVIFYLAESSLLVLAKLDFPWQEINFSLRVLIALIIYSGCLFLPILFPVFYFFVRERKNIFQHFGIYNEWFFPSMIFFYLYFILSALSFIGGATTMASERVVDYFHLTIFLVGLWISATLSHNLQPLIRYIQRNIGDFNLKYHILFPALLFLFLNFFTAPLILTTRLNENLIAASITFSGVILVCIDIYLIRKKALNALKEIYEREDNIFTGTYNPFVTRCEVIPHEP